MGICLVMKNNFKRSLRHKLRWVLIFILPFVLVLLSNVISQFKNHTYRVGVLDLSMNELTESAQSNIDAMCKELNTIDGVDAKPADLHSFHTDLITGKYQYVVDCSKVFSTDSIITYGTEKELNHFVETITKSGSIPDESVNSNPGSIKEQTMNQSIAFLLCMFLIFAVLQGGMLLRDKNSGMILRFCYSSNGKGSYFAGNALFMFLITCLQVTICFLLLCIANNVWFSLIHSLIIISFISVITSIFALILCVICNNDTQASISASCLASLFMLLGGTFVAYESMPGVLQFFSNCSPIRWCLQIIMNF